MTMTKLAKLDGDEGKLPIVAEDAVQADFLAVTSTGSAAGRHVVMITDIDMEVGACPTTTSIVSRRASLQKSTTQKTKYTNPGHAQFFAHQVNDLNSKLAEKSSKRWKWLPRRSVVYKIALVGFTPLISVLLLQLLYPDQNWEKFCPREAICCPDYRSILLLLVSRLSAYAMYPMMILIFWSKCRSAIGWLSFTQLSLWVNFSESHELHKAGGWFLVYGTIIHVLFHVIRYAINSEMKLLVIHHTGITGLVMCVAIVGIVLPMAVECVKKKMSWEVRKYSHTILALLCALAATLHASSTYILYIGICCMTIYFLDYFYVQFFMTHRVETAFFHRLENSTVVTFTNPEGMLVRRPHGYYHICVPFVSTSEWHAFSVNKLCEDSWGNSGVSCFCILKAGDWTTKLYDAINFEARRPIWIQGPFASPYSAASDFEDLLCVASGVGVTPAIQTIQTLKTTRAVHLVWVCRDASMIEFYLNHITLNDSGWFLIFYTGKRKLMLTSDLPNTCLIFSCRPDLGATMSSIIVHSSKGWPDEIYKQRDAQTLSFTHLGEYLNEDMLSGTDAEMVLKSLLAQTLQSFTMKEIRDSVSVPEQNANGSKNYCPKNGNKISIKGNEDEITMPDLVKWISRWGPPVLMSDELIKSLQDLLSTEDKAVDKPPMVSRNKLKAFVNRVMMEFEAGSAATKFDISAVVDVNAPEWGMIKKQWQVLYCGNSDAVVNDLRGFCKKYDISFKKEKFDW